LVVVLLVALDVVLVHKLFVGFLGDTPADQLDGFGLKPLLVDLEFELRLEVFEFVRSEENCHFSGLVSKEHAVEKFCIKDAFVAFVELNVELEVVDEVVGQLDLERRCGTHGHVAEVDGLGQPDLDFEVFFGLSLEFEPQDVVVLRLDLDFIVLDLVPLGRALYADDFTAAWRQLPHLFLLEFEHLGDGLHDHHPRLLRADVGHFEFFGHSLVGFTPDEYQRVGREFYVFLYQTSYFFG